MPYDPHRRALGDYYAADEISRGLVILIALGAVLLLCVGLFWWLVR